MKKKKKVKRLEACKSCKNKTKFIDRLKAKIKLILRKDDRILGKCWVLFDDDLIILKQSGDEYCEDDYDWNGNCWYCNSKDCLEDISEEVKKEYEALGDKDYMENKLVYLCSKCNQEIEIRNY